MEILEDVINIVRRAGAEVLRIYNSGFSVREKQKDDPVTEADLASEKIILAGLKKYGYGILSEETDDDLKRLKKDKVWLVDPLDGTKDFVQKTGQFSIMVAVSQKGMPVLGVVYQPTEDKLYWAESGKGAFLQKDKKIQKLQVSNISKLEEIRFIVSRHHLDPKEAEFARAMNFKEMLQMGSAGLKVGRLAQGKADLYMNTSPKTWEWDTCASDIIIREAGGILTDIKGSQIKYNKPDARNLNGLLATNGLLHKKILKEIKNFFTPRKKP